MKFPLSCFVLAVVSAFGLSATVGAQETGDDQAQKIAEMQSMITDLQTELKSLKTAQARGPETPTPVEKPTAARRATPTEPTPALNAPANYSSPLPTMNYSSPLPPANYSSPLPPTNYSSPIPPANYSSFQPSSPGFSSPGFSSPGFSSPQGGNYRPVYPQYTGPPLEPVYLSQPQVVIVEPAYGSQFGGYGYGYDSGYGYGGYGHGGFGYGGYGYGGDYGGAGLYVGRNGWGLDVGGLQLDFFGNGHGHGRGNGHGGGHKGHKGHKKH